MSRPIRIEYKDAWYHVMNRGRRKDKIFYYDSDYIGFKDLLYESTELWGVNICAYCCMPNHYHLLVQTPQANLSRFMRHLNGIYTQRFNRIHKKDGALFRGRFNSNLIGEDNYLLVLLRYMHFNPVKAGLVEKPENYPWSSYVSYFDESIEKDWLRKDLILQKLKGGNKKKSVAQLRYDAPEEIYAFFAKKNRPSVLGSKEFVAQIKDNFFRQLVHPEIPDSKQTSLEPERVIQVVASFFKLKKEDLFRQRRGKENLPRDLAIYLIRMDTGLTLPKIGKIFGIESYSTVSNSIERINRRKKKNKEIQKIVNKIKSIV